jgi:multidrug efflux pump subunit AcrB
MNTLSTLVGVITSFIKYGINYKVIVQASPEYRALPEDILKLYVKTTEMKWSLILLSWLKKYMDYQRLLDTICTSYRD